MDMKKQTTLASIFSNVFSAKVWTVLFIASNVGSGIRMAMKPEKSARTFGYEAKPVPRVLIEGCGYIALNSSLTLSLLAAGLTSIHRAVGFGLVLREAWLVKSFVTGKFLGANLRPGAFLKLLAFVLMPACACSLIGNVANPQRAGVIITSSLLLMSFAILLHPVGAARWLFDVDLSASHMVLDRGVFRGFGQGNLINSTLLTLLIHGMDLHKALGCTCIMWGCISLYGGFISTMGTDLGISRKKFVIQMVTAGLFALVLLSQPDKKPKKPR